MLLRALRQLSPLVWMLVAVAALGATMVPAVAHAEGDAHARSLVLEKMKNEQRIALVIGNGAYTSGALKNPPGDARLMKQTLEGLGFEVILLVDASQDEMKRAINDFGDRLEGIDDRGGVALFYYAGHGLQVDGHNYLVPTSARIKGKRDIDVETIDVERVLAKMDQAKSRLNVVILDACRNNPFLSDKRAINPGLAQPGSARGTVIAYATGPNSIADDGEGSNSVYTRALAEAMAEPGLELNEVFQTVRERVLASTDRRQTPWESSSKVGQFFFKPGSIPAGRLSGALDVAASARVGVALELDFGPLLGAVVGGDLAASCTGGCSATLPFGFRGVIHGAYQGSSGFGLGVDVGYLLTRRTLSGRPEEVVPVGGRVAVVDGAPVNNGAVANKGPVEDVLSLSGLTVGASAQYHRGEAWPLLFRFGAGVFLGSVSDSRTGSFVSSGTEKQAGSPYSVDLTTNTRATYLYFAPEVRIGRRITEHFEVSLGMELLFMAALSQPKWQDNTKILTFSPGAKTTGDGAGTFGEDSIFGSFMFLVAPGVGARYVF